MADRNPDLAWVFVYTREAHPGDHVGPHDTFATKLANARLLRDEIGIRRPILVDDLAGTGHRAYGSLPNMTWVVQRGGRIIYKADWTSAANVEAFVHRYRDARGHRAAGGVLSPYLSEQLEFRHTDLGMFYAHLRRNGPRACDEFKRAQKLWNRRGG